MNTEAKIITFWSHCPSSGASFTAINFARLLSNKKIKCALLDFDLTAPSLATYFDSEDLVHGLDNLMPYIVGKNLTQGILESNFQKTGSITWLRGTDTPEQSRFVKAEDLLSIIEIIKEMFHVIILDTSGIINNAGTYIALKSADKCFVVTDKDTIKIRRYNQIKTFINTEVKNPLLILNTGMNKSIPLDKQEVSDYCDIPNIYELPDLGPEFTKVLNQGKWYEYMDKNRHMAKLYNKKAEEIIQKELVKF